MRVLVLSANTGAGHNSAAAAIEEALLARGEICEIVDSLAFISERVSDFISWGHSYVYRKFPRLFGAGYRFEENHSVRFIYDQCAKGAPALQRKLNEGWDAVVCVHVFSGMMMTELRRRAGKSLPCVFVATDYTCSPGVSELDMDLFFIPHASLAGEFVRNGVPRERIVASGIPIRRAFYESVEKDEAKRVLGLPREGSMVMLSCGSMGCGHMEKNALELCEQIPSGAYLAVICGSNRKTYEALLPYESERLRVIGFTDQMPLYMSAAELYITKPGGLTTSEAIAKRLPMIFINAVPGCETRNYDFLIRCGIASGAKRWKQVRGAVNQELRRRELPRKQIRMMQGFLEEKHAADEVCEGLRSLTSERKA